jgi:hypothetical protein
MCQTAAKIILEPIFEADFRGCSFGFRPKRSAHQALDQIKREVMRTRRWVIDADIRGCFDALDRAWEDDHGGLGVLVRYCDDLVIVCRTEAQAQAAVPQLRASLADLRL